MRAVHRRRRLRNMCPSCWHVSFELILSERNAWGHVGVHHNPIPRNFKVHCHVSRNRKVETSFRQRRARRRSLVNANSIHCRSRFRPLFFGRPVRALLWLGSGLGDGLHAAGCGHTDGAAGLEAFEVTWSATTVSSTGTEWRLARTSRKALGVKQMGVKSSRTRVSRVGLSCR